MLPTPQTMPKHFKVDARTVISLGRDNAKDRVTAIVELIKNSYDAGAQLAWLDLSVRTDAPDRYIRLVDNGNGMTESQLDENWLTIGYSEKRGMTVGGSDERTQAGEKGIGRLSSNRLGSRLILHTQATKQPAIGISVDWQLFEASGQLVNAVPVEEVPKPVVDLVGLPELPSNEPLRRDSGTEMWILDLREKWSLPDIVDLRDELTLMFTPVTSGKPFHIYLTNDIDKSLDGFVSPLSPPDVAQLYMHAALGQNGRISYSIWDNTADAPEGPRRLDSVTDGPFDLFAAGDCGPLDIGLYYIPRALGLDRRTLSRIRQVQLRHAGVRIFRDNILVKPYGRQGDPAFDWLGLGARQGNNPAGRSRKSYRVKPNQLIGVVNVSRKKNPLLIDVSGREGLIQNEAFSSLSYFVLHCIRILEVHAHRVFVAEGEKEKESDKQSPREQLSLLHKGIVRIRKKISALHPILEQKDREQVSDVESELKSFENILESTKSGVINVHEEVLALRALSTTAIASAVFAHETQNQLYSITSAAEAASIHLSKDRLVKAKKEIGKISLASNSLLQWGDFTLSRLRKDRRKQARISWTAVARRIIEDLEPMFARAKISIDFDGQEDITSRIFQSDLETILVNLLVNAYQALEKHPVEPRRIGLRLSVVTTPTDKSMIEICIADSGPGVSPDLRDKVWLPLFTTRKDERGNLTGTGLGLWIVDSTIRDHGGTRLVEADPLLGGALFRVRLPWRKERD